MKQLSIINCQLSIILLLLLCGPPAMAQEELVKSEHSYRRYTVHDGLPSNSCSDIYQDSRGFIWIASSYGLSRFDGFDFKTFLNEKYANLFFIKENRKGEIEALTNNIRYTVDKQEDTVRTTILSDIFYITKNSHFLPSGYGVFYSSGGKNSEQHFFKITKTGIEKFIESEYIGDFYVDTYYNFYYDEQMEQLYIPYEEGIKMIDKNGLLAFYEGIVAYSFVKYNGDLWITSPSGLYKLEKGNFRQMVSMELKTTGLARVSPDNSLIFSDIETIYRLKEGRVEKIFSAPGIGNYIIDNEGNLWVSTANGLYNLFNLQFKNYVLKDKNDIFGSVIYYPENKTIIAGTEKGNLFEVSEEKIKKINFPSKYSSNPVSFLSFVGVNQNALSDGAVYIPAGADILRIKGKKANWVGITAEADYEIFNVLVKPDGNLLAGTQNSISEVTATGKQVRIYKPISFFKQAMFSNLCFDKQGRILYGGYYGLGMLGKDSVENTLFSPEYMFCCVIRNDNDGCSWFTSENRLYKIENETATLQKTFDEIIQNLYFTKNNRIVVVTTGKIHIFDKELKNSVFYNHENGFTGEKASKTPIAEDDNGNVYLPCDAAMVWFNPEELLKKQPTPRLLLLSFKVSQDNINWQSQNMDSLNFNYKQKHVSINYIGLSYSSAQNVRYHYRLKGFQDDWSEPTKNREITFNNLPPGNYVFEIYADAGTDESRSEIQSLAFSIKPAFWQTAWFLVACIASLMLASAGIALYIQRKKNKALLEKLRAEKELNELRISSIRLKAIPHFNANVLAAIEYYIANRTKEEAMRILGIYSDFTYKTLSEVDKAARPLSEELAYVKMYLDLEKIRFLDKFDFQIKVEDEVDKSVQLPNMILHTYCENAVKHGLMPLKSGGLLTIQVSQQNNIVCVCVEDNGVGRSYAAQNPQLHSSKQGLSILNRQIEIYNRFNSEKINHQVKDLFENEKPCGTLFSVEVPLEFEYIN